MRRLHRISNFALVVALWATSASRCLAADAAADFSATLNPSGNWSYGSSVSRGALFGLYTLHSTDGSGLDIWNDARSLPLLSHNGTGSLIVTTATFPPGALSLHPGGGGENSVLRWTAPAGGSYQIAANFIGRSGAGGLYPLTTTDVAVLHGSTELFSGWINLNGAGDSASWSGTQAMSTGDTVDFTVGHGGNGHLYDTTGLDAIITSSSVDVAEAAGYREFTVAIMPNPARTAAVFSIGLPYASVARVRVFDLSGRLVREVWNGVLPAGTSQLTWNGLDAGPRAAANGLYLVRVEARGRSVTSKLILAR